MNPRATLVLALAASILAVPPVSAQEEDGEMAAMMEAYEKAGTPGEHHEHLGRMVGEWDAEVRMYMEPGAEPAVTQAASTVEWVMDGRFVKETVESEFMGQPFHGVGYTGYNNVAGEYEATWMDNHSTALYRYTGHVDDQGRMVFHSESVDPVTGETVQEKGVSEFVSDDEMIVRSYRLEDGEEVLTMELRYERKKG